MTSYKPFKPPKTPKTPKTPKFPESQTVAVLGTAHISLRDADLLEAIIDGLEGPLVPITVINDNDYGYWIFSAGETDPAAMRAIGFSDAFVSLLGEAQRAGFTWLRLDCDGETSEAFPTFEWPVIREDLVKRVAKQFKAVFSAQINGDTDALQCLVNGLKYGLVGKLGVHAAELIKGAELIGFKMSRKATYDYLFNRPLDLADDEFFLSDEDGHLQRMTAKRSQHHYHTKEATWVSALKIAAAEAEGGELSDEDGHPQRMTAKRSQHHYHLFYRCPRCGQEWEDDWDCEVNGECPRCGARHIEPLRSEDSSER